MSSPCDLLEWSNSSSDLADFPPLDGLPEFGSNTSTLWRSKKQKRPAPGVNDNSVDEVIGYMQKRKRREQGKGAGFSSSAEQEQQEEKKDCETTFDPTEYHQSNVAKYFDVKLYYGIVTNSFRAVDGKWCWQIDYEDGDSEDLYIGELEYAIQLFQRNPPPAPQAREYDNDCFDLPLDDRSLDSQSDLPDALTEQDLAFDLVRESESRDVVKRTAFPPLAIFEPQEEEKALLLQDAGDLILSALGPGSAENSVQGKSTKHYGENCVKPMDPSSDPLTKHFLYARVAKYFGDDLYFGMVAECLFYQDQHCEKCPSDESALKIEDKNDENSNTEIECLWVVHFDDGDCEDWDRSEVSLGIRLCQQKINETQCDLLDIYHVAPDQLDFHPDFAQSAETVAKFYLFILERQRVWVRRSVYNKREPAMWTNCKVMRKFHFCNNYRQLDRGTAYFHSQMLERWDRMSPKDWKKWFVQVLWASYCYRLVNRLETFKCCWAACSHTATSDGIPTIDQWPIFKQFVIRVQSNNKKLFTGAHQTCSFSNYIRWMDTVFSNRERLDFVAAAAHSLESCVRAISKNLPGCGPFMSWQVACDLVESNCFQVPPEVDFCVLGRGSKAGIREVFYPSSKDSGLTSKCYLKYLKLLVEHQDKVFRLLTRGHGLQLIFPKWRGIQLGVKEMEHALCEFSKFQRLERSFLGGEATAQRLRKSRSKLDANIGCFRCKSCTSNVVQCDMCNQGFCSSCDDSSRDPVSWVCWRCLEFEHFRWGAANIASGIYDC